MCRCWLLLIFGLAVGAPIAQATDRVPVAIPPAGQDAAETRPVLENTEPNQTRPGVIRTHDQGIMRTKVVLVGTLAKTDVFGVSPAKASDLVQWDEFGICPRTVPYLSSCGGFGRTPKPLLRSSPALPQPKRLVNLVNAEDLRTRWLFVFLLQQRPCSDPRPCSSGWG